MTATRAAGPPTGLTSLPPRPGQLHWLVTLLVGLAFSGNGVALGAVSFAMPGMRREWQLSASDLGYMAAGLGLGQIVGGLLIGWLADRWGRKRSFAATIAVMAVAMGLAGAAPTPEIAGLMLFVSGIGFSGVAPVASSLLGEFAPPDVRGQLMAWAHVLWAAGFSLAAIGGAALADNLGWRWILALGALPIFLAILGWRFTPESPRFLLAHGRRAEAEALVLELEARYGVQLPLPEQQLARDGSNPLDDLRELWSPVFRKRTLTLWLTWFVMIACFSGPVIWLPEILSTVRGGGAAGTRASLIVSLFVLPASLLCVALIERTGRRRLLGVSLGVASVGTIAVGFAPSEITVILSGGAMIGGLMMCWPVVFGYCAELYPTRLRATAAGWAVAFSRIGGILAPVLLGALLGATSERLAFAVAFFGVLLLVGVALVAFFGEDTTGLTLEELSG